MSATVRLSGRLPKDDETNGLDAHVDELVKDPDEIRVGVVWFDVSKITRDTDAHVDVPTARVRRIELLDNQSDVDLARQLGQRELSRRTGRAALPLTDVVEDDLTVDD